MNSSATPRRLLHVIASPRGASKSRAVAHTYTQERQRLNTSLMVEELDLWSVQLPEISGDTLSAKYAVLARTEHTAAQRDAWAAVVALTRHFASFDEYVFSVPMWNLGIPYRLKHFIDVVSQPGMTFTWTPTEGYQGLLHKRRAFVAYASAFDYSPGAPLAPLDVQKCYVETWLQLIGITDIVSVDCGPTSPAMAGSEQAQAIAHHQAKVAAAG